MNFADKIIIKDLELFAYHGVNTEEKRDGQVFLLSLTCFLDLSKATKSDDLNDTVSYAKIIKIARSVFCKESYDLIERAAAVVCDAVLAEFEQINQVSLLLKKPDAPIKADFAYVAVELTRSR